MSEASLDARIHERGYRRYDGPRFGPAYAARSLVLHTLQRILGIHRPARAKVFPIMAIALAYLPPAVFVGLAAFLPDQIERQALPEYGFVYGFVSAAIILFVVFAAPEALCPDRRSGLLSLYLSAPLTRARYLASKAVAVALVLLAVTLGPPLLYLIGLTLQSAGPDSVGDWLLALLRVVGAGIELSAVFTALSMAVASVTDRRAVAAAGTFIFLQGSHAVAGVLVFGLGLSANLLVLSLMGTPFALALQVHGQSPGDEDVPALAVVILAALTWTAAGAAVAWWRYRRLQVTR